MRKEEKPIVLLLLFFLVVVSSVPVLGFNWYCANIAKITVVMNHIRPVFTFSVAVKMNTAAVV